MILPYLVSGSTYLRQRVATFRRKMRNLAPAMTGSTISAARKTGIIFLTFTA
jgi:hypothetical protein